MHISILVIFYHFKIYNQGQISFCQNRVLPYSAEFTTYGYSSIITDCNNAQNSSTGIVTNRYYYHTNQLGSVIALTNSTGIVMQVYSYDSFGKAYVNNSGALVPLDTYSGSTYSNTRLYTGREYDKEIGMYYLRARYYNANTGKFISRDPVGQNDQINLYTYVANSPLKYVDRMGRDKVLIMYSPNHWYDMFSTELGAKALEQSLRKKVGPNARLKISVVKVESAEDFKKAISEFNLNKDYKNGHMAYVGHNKGWLSKNLTDDYIKQLPTLSVGTDVSLFGCSTVVDNSENDISGSNQIAQKLANQFNVPVSGSDKAITFEDWGSTIKIESNSWHTALPGGKILQETGWAESIYNSIF